MTPHWTSSFFGPLYGLLYSRYLLAPERTNAEALFTQTILGLPGRRVLDLAAGFGRHARLLARHSHVVALDLNRDYLRMARRGLGTKTARNLHLVSADMRRLPFPGESFDAVLLLFNSFGYFLPETPVAPDAGKDPNLQVVHEVARVLRPGGDLLLEVPNHTTLLAGVADAPRRHLVTADYEIEEEYAYDRKACVLHNRTIFRMARRNEEVGYALRLYSRAELTALLRTALLRVVKCYGDYSGSAFSAGKSGMLLAHARKSVS